MANKTVAKDFLTESVESGHPEFVAIALRHYPDTQGLDGDGVPLIHYGAGGYSSREDVPGRARFDPANVVKLLLQAGSDANARDRRGNTPLHHACDAAVVRVLIQGGGDLNAKNADGDTPLETVEGEDVAMALLAAGAEFPADPRHLHALTRKAAKKGWTKVLKTLQRASHGAATP